MRRTLLLSLVPALIAVSVAPLARAQAPDTYSAMHWRAIGPTRAGRARAVVGVPSQPNVAYIGFDNGGVWRSTDYGSTWQALFAELSSPLRLELVEARSFSCGVVVHVYRPR